MIDLKDVSVIRKGKTLLKDISWQIRSGEHWIISGDNGAGKTNLAKLLHLDFRASKGIVHYPFVDRMPEKSYPSDHIRLVSFTDTSKLFKSVNHVHYYQQRFNAFDADGHLTTRQYLETSGLDFGKSEHVDLVHLLGLHDLLDRERIKLSSGQTRKMLLCKALLTKPHILILDNPYLGLDRDSRNVLNDFLDLLADTHTMTIILSGQFDHLPKCINQHIRLLEGRVQYIGNEPYKAENKLYTHDDRLLYKIKNHFENGSQGRHDVVMRFNDVTIKYNDDTILNNFNWEVRRGEKWVLKGNNGSGKSTIVSLIYADNPQAYANEIYLFGHRRGKSGQSIWDVKRRMGFTSPELHAYFNKKMTAWELVLSGLFDVFEVLSSPSSQAQELAILLFQYFDIIDQKDVPFDTLSTGSQRMLFFIRALIKCPEFLLLDEPFQGFDERSKYLSKTLLNHILMEDYTLIFISHFKDEIPKCVRYTRVLDT